MDAVIAYRTYIEHFKRRASADYPFDRQEIFDILPQNFRIAVAEPGDLRDAYLAAVDLDALYALIRRIETDVRKMRERLSISVSKSFDMPPPPVPGLPPTRRRGRQVAIVTAAARAVAAQPHSPPAPPAHFQYQPALTRATAGHSRASTCARSRRQELQVQGKIPQAKDPSSQARRRRRGRDRDRAARRRRRRATGLGRERLAARSGRAVHGLDRLALRPGRTAAVHFQLQRQPHRQQHPAVPTARALRLDADQPARHRRRAAGPDRPRPSPAARPQRSIPTLGPTDFYRNFRRSFNSRGRDGRYRAQPNAAVEIAKHPFPDSEGCCWCLGTDHPLDVCAIYKSAGQPLWNEGACKYVVATGI